jgi:hypothetical protein
MVQCAVRSRRRCVFVSSEVRAVIALECRGEGAVARDVRCAAHVGAVPVETRVDCRAAGATPNTVQYGARGAGRRSYFTAGWLVLCVCLSVHPGRDLL